MRISGLRDSTLIAILNATVLGVKKENHVAGLIKQKAETLQLFKPLLQLGIIVFADRTLSQADNSPSDQWVILRWVRGLGHRPSRCL